MARAETLLHLNKFYHLESLNDTLSIQNLISVINT